jgi:hypothetical protein
MKLPIKLHVHNMLIHTRHCYLSSTHFWKGEMQQPMQPRCSQHAHPYKPLPSFIHPLLEGGDATTYATNVFTTCSSIQSHCHLSSTQFWKGEMQQPIQPMCSQHAHPSKAIAIFHKGEMQQPMQPKCSWHAHPLQSCCHLSSKDDTSLGVGTQGVVWVYTPVLTKPGD